MKKQLFVFILLVSCFSSISAAQVKIQKKVTNKKTILEIDRLYEKYKNTKTITLATTKGDFEGNVSIEFNDSKKPTSIIIEGETWNLEALAEFITKIIKAKLKQYNQIESGIIEEESTTVFLSMGQEISENYSKGDLYFTVKAKRYYCDENGEEIFPSNGTTFNIKYRWKIETGNNRRKISENAKQFEF